jgi:iron complex outermembrane recepter protein
MRAMSRPIELRLCLAIVAWMFDSVRGVFAQDGVLSQLPVNQANRQQFILAQESASITAETERIIVTGSNIPTAQEQASIPVTTYTAQWLQKSGSNTPVEGLRQLPTFVGNAETENDSNGGDGAANINLRGLGAENTLVLMNGRRMIGGNGLAADLNLIPLSPVQKVDVLKDGASSIYGSDAVAGVVNFMMWNDIRDYGPIYEGAEFEVRYGNTTDRDANLRQAWIRGGVTGMDGKVAIFAAAEYYNRAGLFSIDRFISQTADTSNNPNIGLNPNIGVTGLGLGGVNNNSPTFAGKIFISAAFPDLSPSGTMTLIDLGNATPNVASYRPFDVPSGTDPNRFNFRAFTPAIPAMEKSMTYVTGRYKVFGDALMVYGDMLYTHERQKNALAGAPFNTGGDAARGSPFNPFPLDDREFLADGVTPNSNFGRSIVTNVSYRLQQELANRVSTFDKDYWRWLVAVKGDLDFADNNWISHFGYDSGIVYERFEEQEIDSGDATFTGITNQIFAGNFNPFIGQNAPPVGVAPIYNTTDPAAPEFLTGVPIGTAAYDNTQAALASAYLGHSFFRNKTATWDVTLNAHLLPNLYNGGIDVAAGYVHRYQQDEQIGDSVQAAGDQLGFNAVPNAKFQQVVNAWFTEIKIPFVTSTMNVPFVNYFEVDYAFRFEEFTDHDLTNPNLPITGNARTPHDLTHFDNGGDNRVTVGWRPIPDLLLRGTYGTSSRSPAPDDLFFPTFQDFPVVFDPCGNCPTAGTLQPPQGVWERGNPGLKPEETTNWTAGIVYSPKFVPGFTVTVDWYQIYTTNVIVAADDFSQVLLSQGVIDPDGFGNGSGTLQGPGGTGLGITRDQFGGLEAIDSVTGNAGIRFVQGVDVAMNYELPTTNFGKFTFTIGYNHFFTWKISPGPGLPFNDFLGNYNNGTLPLAPGAVPWNKGFARGEWEYKLGPGNLDFIAQVNYVGSFLDDGGFFHPLDQENLEPDPLKQPSWKFNRKVTSYITLDLQASYEFVRPPVEAPVPGYSKEGKDFKSPIGKQPVTPVAEASIWQRMLWGTKVTAGVVNAFDRNPPTVLGAFNDNYDTSLYTIRNRFWYVALSKKF